MGHTVTESELVLPSLFIMSTKKDGCVSTSELIERLTDIFKPTGLDAMILEGRRDTYFSQKVRNLKSHSTFSRYGYAEDIYQGFRITEKGRAFVLSKNDVLKYMFADFNVEDILSSCGSLLHTQSRKVIPLSEFIEEGSLVKVTTSVKIRTRSARLRDVAIEHFSHNGLLYCDCCNFESKAFYGDTYGLKGCIEIHHIKPIYQYEDDDENKTIEAALRNLMPVCPNCHRIIHKNKIGASDMPLFKQSICQTYCAR